MPIFYTIILKKARHNVTIFAMNGILIVNHFLKGEKFDTLHAHLVKTAENLGINLIVKTNLEAVFMADEPDFVLFWDKDIMLAKTLEARGIPVFNSSDAIRKCDNKAETYIALSGIVKQPKTIIAPMTFFKSDFSQFIRSSAKILGFPLVFKECYGSFGEQVYLCKNIDDVLMHVSEKPFILQEYIAESSGSDIRIEVVGGKAVCAMRRENKNDFRANITNGGTAYPFEPSTEQCKIAVDACHALGLDFGGVDILGSDIVCEVNSNAHIINIMNSTGIDIAPLIFEDILSKL